MNEASTASGVDPSLTPALSLGLLLAALALVCVGGILWRSAARLGATLHIEEPRTWTRALRVACVCAGLLALATTWREQGDAAPLSAALLGVLSLLAFITPSGESQRVAEHGVRRGFDSKRFEELEEWRLTGEHLRWKLDGEWLACRAPTELHAALRAKLVALNPERESRFA